MVQDSEILRWSSTFQHVFVFTDFDFFFFFTQTFISTNDTYINMDNINALQIYNTVTKIQKKKTKNKPITTQPQT